MTQTASLQLPVRGTAQTNECNDYKACSHAMQLTLAQPGAGLPILELYSLPRKHAGRL